MKRAKAAHDFAAIGRKGGQVSSARKRKASLVSLEKAHQATRILTNEDVQAIRRKLKPLFDIRKKVSQQGVAKEYGVSQSVISKIMNGTYRVKD